MGLSKNFVQWNFSGVQYCLSNSQLCGYEVMMMKLCGNSLQNSGRSRNVLGARKSSLTLRDTTDYQSKFVASPVPRWLSSFARECLRKGGGFPYCLQTCGCTRICACAFQRKERAFWMVIALSLSSTKRPEKIDGDEVSGKFWLLTKSQFQTLNFAVMR